MVTLAQAQQLLVYFLRFAETESAPVAAAVADRSGELVACARQDGVDSTQLRLAISTATANSGSTPENNASLRMLFVDPALPEQISGLVIGLAGQHRSLLNAIAQQSLSEALSFYGRYMKQIS
jgi:hypothetical protein